MSDMEITKCKVQTMFKVITSKAKPNPAILQLKKTMGRTHKIKN